MTHLKLIAALLLIICAGLPTSFASAESIAEIIERNKTVDTPPPPAIFPYIYTANFVLEQAER